MPTQREQAILEDISFLNDELQSMDDDDPAWDSTNESMDRAVAQLARETNLPYEDLNETLSDGIFTRGADVGDYLGEYIDDNKSGIMDTRDSSSTPGTNAVYPK